MRLAILAPVLLLLALTASGQAVLHGVVLEEGSLRPLPDAHARWEGTGQGAVSDAQGRFALAMPKGDQATLIVSHTGHAIHRSSIRLGRIGAEPAMITLAVKAVELKPFEVAARPVPELVYQQAELHVGAFAVNADGLWVLAYEKPRMWNREERAGEQVLLASHMVLLDTLFHEKATVQLPGAVKRLVRDHARRVIAEGEREAWLLSADHDGLRFTRISADAFRDRVLPWTDSTAGRLIGNNRHDAYPAFNHVLHRFTDGSDQLICSVQDDFVMELYRSQYKYMSGRDKVIAMGLELETGIDREVIAGHMTGFSRDRYFRMPYAPLFRVRDTLCVFHHTKGMIMRFTLDGEPAGETAMKHPEEKSFKRMLVQDAATDRVYAIFRRGPVAMLRSVDPFTGELGAEQVLSYPHPEDLQVHDGHVYYVYRPFESQQKRALYRERLTE